MLDLGFESLIEENTETDKTFDELFTDAILEESQSIEQDKALLNLIEMRALLLDESIDNTTLMKVAGTSFENMTIDNIDNVLKQHGIEEGFERIIDLQSSSPVLGWLTGMTLFATSSFKKSAELALSDLKHYEKVVLPTLTDEQLKKNIETRRFKGWSYKLLMTRLNGMVNFLQYAVEIINTGKPVDVSKIRSLVDNMGFHGYWKTLWLNIKSPFTGENEIKRRTLAEAGYSKDSLREILGKVEQIDSLIRKMHTQQSSTTTDLNVKNIAKRDITVEEKRDLRQVRKQFAKGMKKVYNKMIVTLGFARLPCKQIVYKGVWDNLTKR